MAALTWYDELAHEQPTATLACTPTIMKCNNERRFYILTAKRLSLLPTNSSNTTLGSGNIVLCLLEYIELDDSDCDNMSISVEETSRVEPTARAEIAVLLYATPALAAVPSSDYVVIRGRSVIRKIVQQGTSRPE